MDDTAIGEDGIALSLVSFTTFFFLDVPAVDEEEASAMDCSKAVRAGLDLDRWWSWCISDAKGLSE